MLKKLGEIGFLSLLVMTMAVSSYFIVNYFGWLKWPLDYFAACA